MKQASFPITALRAKGSSVRRATCAHCGTRDATTLDELENGRKVPSCAGCRDVEHPEPDRPLTTGERVLRLVRMNPGAELNELAQAMGEDDEMGRARISAALSRAVRQGLVKGEGGRCERMYYPVKGARWGEPLQ